ncbi:response regulator transcription factor [Symbioplanes lichenis]|uniref:response regulator transcription factor n=1 Tax=Symbioplanes lichenis TaxID=1629072 RepID=UPI0034DAF3DD
MSRTRGGCGLWPFRRDGLRLSTRLGGAPLGHEPARRAGPAPAPDPRLDRLTTREREVLARVGLGESNQEIAAALFLSPATARTYVGRLLGKLQARDRTQLAVLAHRAGLA